MATLQTRIGELERDARRLRDVGNWSDTALLELLGLPAGHVPTDAELERIAADSGAPSIEEGAKHGRTD